MEYFVTKKISTQSTNSHKKSYHPSSREDSPIIKNVALLLYKLKLKFRRLSLQFSVFT